MDATSLTFLDILKAALAGRQAAPGREISPEEWQQLFRMAQIHQVLPLFYQAVYTLPSLAAAAPLGAAMKQQVWHQVIRQTLQTGEFLKLNRLVQQAGLRPLVVKGIVCRNLYPQPDHRPSGDEDILIPEEQFAACHQVLTEFGMVAQGADDYEIPYRKEGSPLHIELHKSLFPPQSDAYGDMNRFFTDAAHRAQPEQIQGNTVYSLSPTDHLFYLICHAFKHFLHSGFGIRQVCDIILYANRYGAQADWLRILENCRSIHADKFAAALFQIGTKYLVFDPELAAYPQFWREIPVDGQPMLKDLLQSGLYGDATLSRKHSSSITLDAVAARKQGKQKKNALLLSAFPPAAKLEGRYPYLKKHPYLVSVAWGSRLWEYAAETRRSRDSNAAEALKIGSDRVELMKIYGILD